MKNNKKRKVRQREREREIVFNYVIVDELLIQYMSTVEHFVGPPPPGSSEELNVMNLENYEEILEKNEMLKENERSFDIETQEILPSSLPIFRMPESGDIIDFLSTMESKMNEENSRLEEMEALKLKKLEIVGNARRFPSPRFYVNRLRRFHQKRK